MTACLFLVAIPVFSQDSELKVWTSLDIKKNVDKWDFTGEIELREDRFFSQMERLSFQIEGMYDFSKVFSAGLSYMIMDFFDEKYQDHQLRHRFQAIANVKVETGRFEFSLREKGEITTKDEKDRIKNDGVIDDYRINPELIWRNRMKAEYDVPGVSLIPSISLETFYFMNDPEGNRFEKLRYTLAFEYKYNKHNRLNLFGHYNDELLEGETDSYVAGLGYTYIF